MMTIDPRSLIRSVLHLKPKKKDEPDPSFGSRPIAAEPPLGQDRYLPS